MATAPITILKTLGSIITTLDLKKLAEEVDNAKNATTWLKNNANPILNFIGKKTSLGKKFGNYAKLITGSISIVDNTLAILQGDLPEANRAQKFGLISSSLESMAGATEELIKSKKLTSKSSNLWFMSIVSAGISLVANIIAGSDGIKPKEKEAINRSYITFMRTLGTDLAKKIFNAATDAQFNRLLTENVMEEAIANGKFFQNASKTFTKAFGVVMTFGTGILNGVDKYKLSMEKYTSDGIPEKIAKHDAFIDALAKFIKETLSGIVVGLDDVIFNGSKWMFSWFGIKYAEDKEDYVEVLADYLKTLNYKNSGTSGDDKVIYVLENKSMVYGDDGNDYIGNYGFSNVTIWGGHDDDTLGSYKTDSATPQKNSIFGGPGDDKISVYDEQSTIHGGAGKDFINVLGTKNKLFGDADNDSIYVANGANNNTISGGTGDDAILLLDEAKNALIKYASGDGNDTIYGFNEDDTLKVSGSYKTSASGNDVIVKAGEGSILLVGAAGKKIKINSKTITRGKENSTIDPVPPPQFPTLPATVASPIIYGTENNDTLRYIDDFKSYAMVFALDGDDAIYNGSGGGYHGYSQVTIDGGEGNDRIINYGASEISINGGSDNDYIALTKTYSGSDSYSDHSTISGGNGDDTIENSGGWNVSIDGGGGNDSINNMYSSVTINGGADDDDISNYGASGNGLDSVSVDGGSGNDLIYASGRDMTINGGAGHDSIFNDYIIRGNYNNWADESATIDGGTGNDSITNYATNVSIVGGDDNDDIRNYLHYTLIEVGNSSATMNVTIDGGNGKDCIWNGEEYLTGGSSISINGGADNDTIFSRSHSVTISGDKGNDSICNNYGEDILFKYANGDGNDTIQGFNTTSTLSITGNKYSTKKSGDDVIVTVGKGKITLQGAASLSAVNIDFNKVLTVTNSTKSPVTVKSDVKIIDASARTTAIKITGNKLDNTIISGSGKNTLYGGAGNDSLVGGSKNDSLSGGKGHDTLSGGEGNDKILGGAGNDILRGGKGNDSLWGNAGADTFIYEAGDGKDTIYGFDSKDTLTLDGLDFTTSYSKSKGTITFKVDGGSVVLKDFTASTFHVNDDVYKISGSKFKKQ